MKLRLIALALAVMSQDAGAERIHINPEQQTEGRADSKRPSDASKSNTTAAAAVAPPQNLTDGQPKADPKTRQSNEESGEYWPWRPFGFRRKVTDSLLVLFGYVVS
jgi:hypothetical protein